MPFYKLENNKKVLRMFNFADDRNKQVICFSMRDGQMKSMSCLMWLNLVFQPIIFVMVLLLLSNVFGQAQNICNIVGAQLTDFSPIISCLAIIASSFFLVLSVIPVYFSKVEYIKIKDPYEVIKKLSYLYEIGSLLNGISLFIYSLMVVIEIHVFNVRLIMMFLLVAATIFIYCHFRTFLVFIRTIK